MLSFLPHFTADFACFTDFLNPPVYQLTAGDSVELNQEDDATLPVSLSDYIKWYNWEAEQDTLKFIISTERFDETLLNIEGLLPPPIPEGNKSAGLAIQKGIVKKAPVKVKGWRTIDVKLIYRNPLYNTITDSDLQTMMQDANTADFARGLYKGAEIKVISTLQPS